METDSYQGKTVLLGVTGGVAAYKACEIVRGLQKHGVRVKVVMTEHATHFIDPTLFRSLTREPVGLGLFDNPRDPIHHISLAKEADVFAIAPCTANVIGKIANGIADDLLTTTAMACTAPFVVAPAMNVNMYEAPATQENLRILARRGAVIVDADDGYLACGDIGRGKLAPVETIVEVILRVLGGIDVAVCADEGSHAALPGASAQVAIATGDTAFLGKPAHVQENQEHQEQDLAGKKVVVTAGPTREYIDPVRFISNPSTGKMGYAVARAAAARGAEVVLISGPVSLEDPAGVFVVRVETAQEMFSAVQGNFDGADIAVFTAAVSDMRPAHPAECKLKKGADDEALSRIELVENPDILKTMARYKGDCTVVGFAAETNDVVENAKRKLHDKGADMIVANKVGAGAGFGADDDAATLVYAANGDDVAESLPSMSKRALADVILNKAQELYQGC